MSSLAPSPRGSLLTGHFREIRRDVLGLMLTGARDCGDIVRFRLGPLTMHLVNHPDPIAHVLIKNRENYDKDSRSSASLSLVCGESLLTANGPAWQWRRRLIQPMFHHAAVAGFIDSMVSCTETMLDDWSEKCRRGETIEAASEMMRLTYRVIGRCLFGANLEAETLAVEEAMHTIVTYTYARWRRILNWPTSWPVEENRQFQNALKSVNAIIGRLIASHIFHPPETPNLLSMLIGGTDGETGAPLTEEQVRHEAITFLLAGHETTANALSWTLHLLTQHPAEAEKIREETPSTTLTMSDLPKLTSTLHVFEESIRLYPPIWAMERHAIAADTIGGYQIPANSSVIISPYTLHRHPIFWEEPEEFRPSRFEKRDPPAYIPFGAGPRFCIGNEFALSEARVILSMILRKFHITAEPGQTIVPEPAITLRLKNGLRLQLRHRS